MGGSSDPYVELSVGGQIERTRVKKNTLQPRWNERFQFRIIDPTREALALHVYDHDSINIGSRDFLGSLTVKSTYTYLLVLSVLSSLSLSPSLSLFPSLSFSSFSSFYFIRFSFASRFRLSPSSSHQPANYISDRIYTTLTSVFVVTHCAL